MVHYPRCMAAKGDPGYKQSDPRDCSYSSHVSHQGAWVGGGVGDWLGKAEILFKITKTSAVDLSW